MSRALAACAVLILGRAGHAPAQTAAPGLVTTHKLSAIGRIGVSGAPGGQFDEECVRVALAKIKDRMK